MNTALILAKLKQYPVAIGLGLLTLILLGVVHFLRTPQIPLIERQLDSLENDWRTIETNLREGVGLAEDLESGETFLATIEAKLINPDDGPINLAYFYDLEEQTGVAFTQLTPSAPAEFDGVNDYVVVNYSITAEGRQEEVLELLYRLQRGARLSRIESVSLTSSGGTGPQQVAMVLNLALLAEKESN